MDNPWLWILIFAVGGFVFINLLSFLIGLTVSAAADSYSKKFFGDYQKQIEICFPARTAANVAARIARFLLIA